MNGLGQCNETHKYTCVGNLAEIWRWMYVDDQLWTIGVASWIRSQQGMQHRTTRCLTPIKQLLSWSCTLVRHVKNWCPQSTYKLWKPQNSYAQQRISGTHKQIHHAWNARWKLEKRNRKEVTIYWHKWITVQRNSQTD